MTTPRLGAPELTEGQATPETTVNEQIRFVEQGASYFIVKDKDLATPPGAPADGDAYIVAAAPTGAWTGWVGRLAIRVNTAWEDIAPIEGTRAYVQDENAVYEYDGAAWASSSTGASEASASEIWVGSETGKYISPDKLYESSAPAVLTSGATIAPDGNNGFNFTLTLAENATLSNPTNFKVGQSGYIEITQDGTGSRTLAYGANWRFPGGAPVLSTAAGAIDLLTYTVVATGRILANLTKAYST